VRAIQRPAETVPPSWTLEVDGGSDILQWGDSTGVIDDRCGCRRDINEQDRRGGEEMALNNYQWSSERGQPKRVGGKYDIDTLTLLQKWML